MTIQGCDTQVGFIILDILNFYAILGIGWLSLYYVVLDFFTILVTLAVSGIHLLVWGEAVLVTSQMGIFLMLGQRFASNRCLDNLSYVCNVSMEGDVCLNIFKNIKKYHGHNCVFTQQGVGVKPNKEWLVQD